MSRIVAVLLAAGVVAGAASGAWQPTGGGSGAAAAKSLPAGNTPGAPSASLRNVTVTWTASTFADATPVPAYVVRRFNAVGGAESAVLANCAGLVAATTCTENNVPPGTWKYTVTPAAAAWRGTQSAQSPSVLVI